MSDIVIQDFNPVTMALLLQRASVLNTSGRRDRGGPHLAKSGVSAPMDSTSPVSMRSITIDAM